MRKYISLLVLLISLSACSKPKEVSIEDEQALEQATIYANDLFLSKNKIKEILSSENGDNFSKESVEYALDNVDTDWNNNALESAKKHNEMLGLKGNKLKEQLISKDGGQFTKKEVDFAMKELNLN